MPLGLTTLIVAIATGAAAADPAPDQQRRAPFRAEVSSPVGSRGPTGLRARQESRYRDPAVAPTTFEKSTAARPALETDRESSTESSSRRKLGAPSSASSSTTGPQRQRLSGMLDGLTSWQAPEGSAATAGAGLAVVIGLVLLSAWIAKKSLPRSAQPLPSEAAEVLGRLRLSGKQTAQLVRVGNKLVLVHLSPAGAETITEITDDADVQRVVAACDRGQGRGSAAEFDDVLERMGAEAASPGFLGDEGAFDPRRLAAAYASTPGGRESA